MKKTLAKLTDSCKGALNVMSITFEVIIVVTLVPVIAVAIATATNLSTTETTLLGLVTLLIVLGLLYAIGKQTGLIKGSGL